MKTIRSSLTNTNIELHIPDFKKAKDFYGKLGFKKVWETPPKKGEKIGYLVMKRDSSIICFYCGNKEIYNHSYFKKFPKNTPKGYGVEIVIHITDQPIEKYYKKILASFERNVILKPLEMRFWGYKDFRIIDPFGFYLCISEPRDILKKPKYSLK